MSDVVGGALWFRAGSMANEVVLVLMLDLVVNGESGAKFFGGVDGFYLGVVCVRDCVVNDFLHFGN